MSKDLYGGWQLFFIVGALCTRDFSFGVFCASDWVGITSVGLGGFATVCFLEVCGVESLRWDRPGMELLLWVWCLDGVKLREPGCLQPGEAGTGDLIWPYGAGFVLFLGVWHHILEIPHRISWHLLPGRCCGTYDWIVLPLGVGKHQWWLIPPPDAVPGLASQLNLWHGPVPWWELWARPSPCHWWS